MKFRRGTYGLTSRATKTARATATGKLAPCPCCTKMLPEEIVCEVCCGAITKHLNDLDHKKTWKHRPEVKAWWTYARSKMVINTTTVGQSLSNSKQPNAATGGNSNGVGESWPGFYTWDGTWRKLRYLPMIGKDGKAMPIPWVHRDPFLLRK